MNSNTAVIIVAGGTGSRMGSGMPKQFLKVMNKEILLHTVETFASCDFVNKIVIVCHSDYTDYCKKLVSEVKKDISVVCGGATRQESVFAGLSEIKEYKYVLVHDAVRCLVTAEDIKKLHAELLSGNSCTLAVRVKDTIKMADDSLFVTDTVPREFLWNIQTPQAFAVSELYSAHKHAIETNFVGTDDCSVVENYGKSVKLVEGSYENIKVTTPSDLKLAEFFMKGCE